MKISPYTAFDKARRRIAASSISLVFVLIGVVALEVINESITYHENQKLQKRIAALEFQALLNRPEPIDLQCGKWLVQSNLLKARDRICGGTQPAK